MTGATTRKLSLVEEVRAAWADKAIMAEAATARAAVAEWCDLVKMPGADTTTRLAHRIYHGMSAEQAAVAEYLYRWALPLRQWISFAETDKPHLRHGCRTMTGAWPVPHLIGM